MELDDFIDRQAAGTRRHDQPQDERPQRLTALHRNEQAVMLPIHSKSLEKRWMIVAGVPGASPEVAWKTTAQPAKTTKNGMSAAASAWA